MRASVEKIQSKRTLAGKTLTVAICLLPFLARKITLPLSSVEQTAYYMSTDSVSDFEQLIREYALFGIAVLAIVAMTIERLGKDRTFSLVPSRWHRVMTICLVGYVLLAIGSTITSDYVSIALRGSYGLYEGLFAILSYVGVFLAAWWWIRGEALEKFVKTVILTLGGALGILAFLEYYGYYYYNITPVHWLSGLEGYVSQTIITLTFGNPDYLGMFCAMLLPVMVATLDGTQGNRVRFVLRGVLALMLAMTLLATQVTNAIVFGFGMTIVYLLLWLWKSGLAKKSKQLVSLATALCLGLVGIGFVATRTGDNLSDKLVHALVGADIEDNFGLLAIAIEGDTLTLSNAETDLAITATTMDLTSLSFTSEGVSVTAILSEDTLSFTEETLRYCSMTIEDEYLYIDLGYTTRLQATLCDGKWNVVGLGGRYLASVPQVCSSRAIQRCYTYMNGRVFVWVNTLQALGDCWIIGHGCATSVFYLIDNDLPALLNIFGGYALFNKPHSWYLQMAQDTGIVSMLLVLALLLVYVIRGGIHIKRGKWNAWHTGLWCSVLAYALCGTMNDSLIYHAPMFWFLFGIAWGSLERQGKREVTGNIEVTGEQESIIET